MRAGGTRAWAQRRKRSPGVRSAVSLTLARVILAGGQGEGHRTPRGDRGRDRDADRGTESRKGVWVSSWLFTSLLAGRGWHDGSLRSLQATAQWPQAGPRLAGVRNRPSDLPPLPGTVPASPRPPRCPLRTGRGAGPRQAEGQHPPRGAFSRLPVPARRAQRRQGCWA